MRLRDVESVAPGGLRERWQGPRHGCPLLDRGLIRWKPDAHDVLHIGAHAFVQAWPGGDINDHAQAEQTGTGARVTASNDAVTLNLLQHQNV
ncbi:hypothetical protein P3T43_005979 [Paraburkholderia sp. GAS41]|jgi:hypothetical protein